MPDFLLGIDAGTTVTKAAIFDRAGGLVATRSARTRVERPRPAWSETDMEAAWATAAGAVRAALGAAGLTGDDIAAVGVSGAMVGAWVIDRDGRPVRPAILWDDARAQGLIESMQARRPDVLSRIFDSSGCVMQQGCTLPVVRWLLDHEPEAMARAAHVVSCKDWLRFRLTGRVAADVTEAAVAPGSARARTRSPEMMDLFGLAGHAHLFPEVFPSEALAGTVTPDAAAQTGLREGTPVAVGAGDVPSSALGAGAVDPGTACTVLGTTCLNCVVAAAPVFEPRDLGLLFTMPAGLWLRSMVNVAGTTNLDWFVTRLMPDVEALGSDRFAMLEAQAEASGPGARGVLYHPYLSETGIIAPVVALGARGQFSGLAPHHDRTDLLRAVYEGVCHAVRDCYDAVGQEVREIVLVGGGARSAFWSQMMADVTGRAILVPDGMEFGAKGAALLAGTAIGWYAGPAEAARATRRLLRRHDPDPARREAYDAAFARYRRGREALLAVLAPKD